MTMETRATRRISADAYERGHQPGAVDFAKLFSHDSIAAQEHWSRQRSRPQTPERRLLIQLLADQLGLLEKYANNARRDLPEHRETRWRREYIDAWGWIAWRGSGTRGFSFDDACEYVGISATKLRQWVLGPGGAEWGPAPCIKPWSYRIERRPKRATPNEPGRHHAAAEWASAQLGEWTIAMMAEAMDAPAVTVRGWLSTWRQAGHLVRMNPSGHHGVARYRWVGGKREVA